MSNYSNLKKKLNSIIIPGNNEENNNNNENYSNLNKNLNNIIIPENNEENFSFRLDSVTEADRRILDNLSDNEKLQFKLMLLEHNMIKNLYNDYVFYNKNKEKTFKAIQDYIKSQKVTLKVINEKVNLNRNEKEILLNKMKEIDIKIIGLTIKLDNLPKKNNKIEKTLNDLKEQKLLLKKEFSLLMTNYNKNKIKEQINNGIKKLESIIKENQIQKKINNSKFIPGNNSKNNNESF